MKREITFLELLYLVVLPNKVDVYTRQTTIIGGAFYFVTFIDGHSRKVWGFALKTKGRIP